MNLGLSQLITEQEQVFPILFRCINQFFSDETSIHPASDRNGLRRP